MICKSYPDLGAGKAAISTHRCPNRLQTASLLRAVQASSPSPRILAVPSTSQEVLVSFRRFSVSIVMVLVVLGVVASAQVEVSTATVPRLIRINGSARDEAGKPLAGNHGITFTLYQDEAGQLTVWQEPRTCHSIQPGALACCWEQRMRQGCRWRFSPRAQHAGWGSAQMDKRSSRESCAKRGLCAQAADTEMLAEDRLRHISLRKLKHANAVGLGSGDSADSKSGSRNHPDEPGAADRVFLHHQRWHCHGQPDHEVHHRLQH